MPLLATMHLEMESLSTQLGLNRLSSSSLYLYLKLRVIPIEKETPPVEIKNIPNAGERKISVVSVRAPPCLIYLLFFAADGAGVATRTRTRS